MGLRNSIGKAIYELRTKKNKTQEEVANDGGISRTDFAKIEKGITTPSISTLLNIAQGLEVSLIELLEKVDYEGIRNYTNPENIIEKTLKVEIAPSEFLYFRGDKSLIKHPQRITIIGKKNPTEFAIKECELITKFLVEKGYVIVSGLEKGIDTVVQKTCLKYNGKAIAVIPSGLRNILPKENRGLAEEVVKSGGLLLSKYPENSSSRPPYYLDSRKIQVNLGKVVIIVESQLNGNEMEAGLYTLKQKKKLFCVDTPEKYWSRAKGNIILIREHDEKVLVLSELSLS